MSIQSMRGTPARARRYRRKVGASGSPVLASSQSAAALAGLRRLEALTTTHRGGPNPSELRAQARRGRLISDAAVATVRAGAAAGPALPARPARDSPLRGVRERTKQLHGRPRYSVYDDPPSRHQRRPSRGTPGSGRRVTVVAAPAQRRGQTADAVEASRTPRSRQGSRGSRPSTATVPEDAELPPQQWPFAVFYQRPLTCERATRVDGVDAITSPPRRRRGLASMPCRLDAVDGRV